MMRPAIIVLALLSAMPAAAQSNQWQFGAFADLGYLFDTNEPPNHETRSRGTAWRVNEVDLNAAAVTATKAAVDTSQWGGELLVHAGRDTEKFAFSPTAPNLAGSNWLRYIGRANMSYRTVSGWQLQGGIFNSLIGYDSLYAKDNLHYTRPWTADFTPYVMLGMNGSRAIGSRLTLTVFGINGYWHLAHANNAPNGGAQIAYTIGPALTVRETVLIGPHQKNTAIELWRYLSDTVIEHRSDHWLLALNAQAAGERVESSGRATWAAAQLPVKWIANRAWSAAIRPEFAIDSSGRFTAFKQRVIAITGTLDHRATMGAVNMIIRLETSHSRSSGEQGGFFARDAVAPSGLTPSQHLFIASVLLSYGR